MSKSKKDIEIVIEDDSEDEEIESDSKMSKYHKERKEKAAIEFRRKVEQVHKGKQIGKYVNAHTKVHCKCKRGHDCYPKPNKIQQGRGICCQCGIKNNKYNKNRKEKAAIEFKKRVEEERGGKQIGKYVKANEPVHCKCSEDHDCYPRPSDIQQNQGLCRTCACRDSIQSAIDFKRRVEQEHGGKQIGEYIRKNEPVHCKCKRGHDCYPRPTHIQSDRDLCATCSKQKSISNGEQFIMDTLEYIDIKFDREIRLKRYFFDFTFEYEGQKYILEFDGAQHFFYISHFHRTPERFIEHQRRDIYKNILASCDYGYKVIRIAFTQIRKQTVEDFSEYLIDLIKNKEVKDTTRDLITDCPLYDFMYPDIIFEECE